MNTLTKANLVKLDMGDVVKKVDEAMDEIVVDVAQRPDVKKSRFVVLTISVTPEVQITPNGFENYPTLEFNVAAKKPPHVRGGRGILTPNRETGEIELLVNDFLPELEPGQETIFDQTEKEDGKL